MSNSTAEMEMDEAELSTMRQKVVAEKLALTSQLVDLNSKCSIRMQARDYQKIQSQRASLIRLLSEKESELSLLNARRHELATVLHIKKTTKPAVDIRELVMIRDKWHDYSMDATHPKAGRDVAWKMSQDLRTMLKRYFEP